MRPRDSLQNSRSTLTELLLQQSQRKEAVSKAHSLNYSRLNDTECEELRETYDLCEVRNARYEKQVKQQ